MEGEAYWNLVAFYLFIIGTKVKSLFYAVASEWINTTEGRARRLNLTFPLSTASGGMPLYCSRGSAP